MKKRLDLVDNLEVSLRNEIILREAAQSQLKQKVELELVTNAKIVELQRELEQFKLREAQFKASEHAVDAAFTQQRIAEAKLEGAMEVTRLVFGNNIVKQTIHTNKQVPVPMQSGSPGGGMSTWVNNHPSEETEKKTVEG